MMREFDECGAFELPSSFLLSLSSSSDDDDDDDDEVEEEEEDPRLRLFIIRLLVDFERMLPLDEKEEGGVES